jgi:hypothetical protein
MVHFKQIPYKKIPDELQKMRGYQFESTLVDLLLEINMELRQEDAKQTERTVEIGDLAPGMVLSRDVLMRTGAFFMAARTRIDGSTIDKLKQYFELGNIGSTVFINK